MGDKATYVVGGIAVILLLVIFVFMFRLFDKIETEEYCNSLPINEAFNDSRCDEYWKSLMNE